MFAGKGRGRVAPAVACGQVVVAGGVMRGAGGGRRGGDGLESKWKRNVRHVKTYQKQASESEMPQ